MFDNHLVRLAPIRRRTLLTVAMALMAPLAFASPALAIEPTGDFAVFKQCPRFNPEVNRCINSQTKSGEVKIRSTAVPIKNPITLQGGINESTEPGTMVAALNGETLSKTPEPVPGGLLDLVKCNEISNFFERIACELVFENGVTGVTATTELAKPASAITISASNLINGEGTALSLPVKVKLDNPFLGSECYIGSNSSPITLNLTTGKTSPPPPNTSISGKVGTLTFKDEFRLTEITNNTLVDNSFAVPAANGCGGIFAFLIDPIINAKLGLPSPVLRMKSRARHTLTPTSYSPVVKATSEHLNPEFSDKKKFLSLSLS
jgi:hypothetical protein